MCVCRGSSAQALQRCGFFTGMYARCVCTVFVYARVGVWVSRMGESPLLFVIVIVMYVERLRHFYYLYYYGTVSKNNSY